MSESVYGGLRLPESIEKLIRGKEYRSESIGQSGAQVMIFDDAVLKIEPRSQETEDTLAMMRWLEGRLPAPKIVHCEENAERIYLLMSKMGGRMSCDEYYLERPELLLSLLADGLRMLWSVDVSGCPRIITLDDELARAERRVAAGLVDIEDTEPETFGEGGFADPDALLRWLKANKPQSEPVLSHGDFCLPNIFLDGKGVAGFIDLGNTGVADRWRDIALCWRSLKHNFDGTYGGKVYEDFDPDRLFDALGMEPDWEKIRYYILLDELF